MIVKSFYITGPEHRIQLYFLSLSNCNKLFIAIVSPNLSPISHPAFLVTSLILSPSPLFIYLPSLTFSLSHPLSELAAIPSSNLSRLPCLTYLPSVTQLIYSPHFTYLFPLY